VALLLGPLTIGMALQWQAAHMEAGLARLVQMCGGLLSWLVAVVASSSAFCGAKAGGFGDWGVRGLSPTERRFNHC
jgi:hypothetical protein